MLFCRTVERLASLEPRFAKQASKGPSIRHRQSEEVSRSRRSRRGNLQDADNAKHLDAAWTLPLQASCLLAQLVLASVLGLSGLSFEVFVVFATTLVGQGLLLVAITPRRAAWNHRDFTVHEVPPLMSHMGMDSNSVLFVRSATLDGQTFS